MYFKTLLLLAVQSNVIFAGVLRRGHYVRPSVFLRSVNESSIVDAAAQRQVSTSPPTISFPEATLASTAKQIGSVPAVGSGPGAAKIDGKDIASANTEPPEALSTAPPAVSTATSTLPVDPSSSSKDVEEPVAITSKQIGKVPAIGTGPGAATIPAQEIASANTKAPPPLPSTAVVSLATSSPELSLSKKNETKSSSVTSKTTTTKLPVQSVTPVTSTIFSSSVPSSTGIAPSAASVSSVAGLKGIYSLLSSSVSSSTGVAPSVASVNSVVGLKGIYSLLSSSVRSNTTNTSVQGKKPLQATGTGPLASAVPTPNQGLGPSTTKVPSASTQPIISSTQPILSDVSTPIAPSSTSSVSPSQETSSSGPTLSPSSPLSAENASGLSSAPPAVPKITSIPEAGISNVDMATTFNVFFDSMNANSACSPGSDTQRMACIDKKVAQCGADGKYTLSPCAQNEICRAVPLAGGETGISIQCIPEAETPGQVAPASVTASAVVPLESTSTPLSPITQNDFSTAAPQGTSTTLNQSPSPSPLVQPSPSLPVSAGSVETQGQTTLQNTPTTTESPLSPAIETPRATTATSVSSEIEPPVIIITTQTPAVSTATSSSPTSSGVSGLKGAFTALFKPSTATPSPQFIEQPAIIIVPETLRTAEPSSSQPTPTGAVSADAPATTPAPAEAFKASDAAVPITVTETVTVTATIHDKF